MIPFSIGQPGGKQLRLLCLGAHSDDIEIGCGATVLSLLRARPDVAVRWVVFSGAGVREAEARRSAELYLRRAAEACVDVHDFRDSFFPHQAAQIKEVFESLKEFQPDVVLTHYRNDAHQDHRVLSELAWNTWRSHMILEYEIPKYDGDLGSPNVFVPVDTEARQEKVDNLMEVFGSQRSKSWFTPETFNGLMRLRGIECASPTGYAEAFYGRKVMVQVG